MADIQPVSGQPIGHIFQKIANTCLECEHPAVTTNGYCEIHDPDSNGAD
jgi:hypothetical protein